MAKCWWPLVPVVCFTVLSPGNSEFARAQVCRSTGNETPKSDVCLVFSPYRYEVGEGGEEYTKATMEQQGYRVIERISDTLNNTPNVKLTDLTGTACGIRFINAHGCGGGVGVEAYAGSTERDAAYDKYKQSGLTDDDMWKTDKRMYDGETNPRVYSITIALSGLQKAGFKAMNDANGTITFCGSCSSIEMAGTFGGREFFGYDNTKNADKSDHDARVLWNYMSGVEDGGNSRPAGLAYNKGLPYAKPGDNGYDLHFMDSMSGERGPGKLQRRSSAAGKTTLCPVVADYFPKGVVWDNCIAYVEFDTKMRALWKESVITVSGGLPLGDFLWDDAKKILSFQVKAQPTVGNDYTFTVLGWRSPAHSNVTFLDGNQNPNGSDGRRPNTDPGLGVDDNFVWTLKGTNAPGAMLALIFKNMPDAQEQAVRDGADAQAHDRPVFKSMQVERITFEGTFIPASNSTKVALFSDDGADVYVNNFPVPVHSRYLEPQYLPDLTQSFHPIWPRPIGQPDVPWQAGVPYTIRIEYSNVEYRGNADIDGATMFAYDGGGEVVE